jgi:hypothetical protein
VCVPMLEIIWKAFAYLHEDSRHHIDLLSLRTEFSLRIRCGRFSYSELPKWAFKGIIGVTGTLSSPSPAEQKIIADEYNLKTYTYTFDVWRVQVIFQEGQPRAHGDRCESIPPNHSERYRG